MRRCGLFVSIVSLFGLAVGAAAAPVSGLPTDLSGSADAVADRAHEAVLRFGLGTFRGAALIVKDGEVAFSRGYGIESPDTLERVDSSTGFDIASVSKPVLAIGVLRLVDAGSLDLDTTLGEIFGGEIAGNASPTTVRALLTHRTTLPRAMRTRGDREDREAAMRGVLSAAAAPTGDEPRQYSNANYSVLAGVIERVAGEPFETFMRREVFHAAGMTDARFVGDADGAGTAARVVRARPGRPAMTLPVATEWGWGWGMKAATGVIASIDDLGALGVALSGGTLLSEDSKALLFGATGGEPLSWVARSVGPELTLFTHAGATQGFGASLVLEPRSGSMVAVLGEDQGEALALSEALESIAFPGFAETTRVELHTSGLALSEFQSRVSEDGGAVSVEGVGKDVVLRVLEGETPLATVTLSQSAAWSLSRRIDEMLAEHYPEALAVDRPGAMGVEGVFAGIYAMRQEREADGEVRVGPEGVDITVSPVYSGNAEFDTQRPTIVVTHERTRMWPVMLIMSPADAAALGDALADRVAAAAATQR